MRCSNPQLLWTHPHQPRIQGSTLDAHSAGLGSGFCSLRTRSLAEGRSAEAITDMIGCLDQEKRRWVFATGP